MFQKVNQPRIKRRPFKHYKCLQCKFIVSNRAYHLERWHDVDRFFLRGMEGEEAIEVYFKNYFIESNDPLTCLKLQYNPGNA